MQGVALQSRDFDEPVTDAHRGVAAPPATGGTGDYVAAHAQQRLALRARRFRQALVALELLIAWTKTERANFQEKVLGAEPVSRARTYSAPKMQRIMGRGHQMSSWQRASLRERQLRAPTDEV